MRLNERLKKLETLSPPESNKPCIWYIVHEGEAEETVRAEAVKKYESEHACELNLNDVFFICWNIVGRKITE